jgi:hypothetical protein
VSDQVAVQLRRPGAGREPAASALLGWLTDAQAPRLCVLTGPAGAGKSHLLAWLLQHSGTRSDENSDRRVHAVAPLTGASVRGALWMLADDLQIAARAPAELIEAVATDKRHTVLIVSDLHTARSPHAVVDQLLLPLLQLPHVKVAVEARTGAPCTQALLGGVPDPAVMDLVDPRWTDRGGFMRWAATRSADARARPDAGAEQAYPLPAQALG